MKTKIYIAGASSEIERAEKWIARCREAGIEVTSTWCDNIRKVGAANPANASFIQRREWALVDLAEVKAAHVFWLLLPSNGHRTDGAWAELAYAHAHGKWIHASGTHHNIFIGLVNWLHTTDEEAFREIVRSALPSDLR